MNTAILEFLYEPALIPFHISVLLLILLSMAETFGNYIGLRPSSFLKKISPSWLIESPLVQVKFSKVLMLNIFSILDLLFLLSKAALLNKLMILFPYLLLSM